MISDEPIFGMANQQPLYYWRVFLSGRRPLAAIDLYSTTRICVLNLKTYRENMEKMTPMFFWHLGTPSAQLRCGTAATGRKIAMSWGSISPGGRKGIDSIEKISKNILGISKTHVLRWELTNGF